MTAAIQETATAPDMIEYLLDHWGLKNHNQLAEELAIDRRSIDQFLRRKGTKDILSRIVIKLSEDIEYLEKQRS